MIQKYDSNWKCFSLFVFYCNVSIKISSTPPRLWNFQEFFDTPVCSNPSTVIRFWRIFQPLHLFQPLPSIRHSTARVLFLKAGVIFGIFKHFGNLPLRTDSLKQVHICSTRKLLLHFITFTGMSVPCMAFELSIYY